eukprot:1444342-Pyramimonas_sp.AAC.1
MQFSARELLIGRAVRIRRGSSFSRSQSVARRAPRGEGTWEPPGGPPEASRDTRGTPNMHPRP